MNTSKINKLVTQIQNNLNDLKVELEISSGAKVSTKSKPINKQLPKKKNQAVDLMQPIKKLFDDNFFVDYKTDLEVKNKLELNLLTNKTPKRASIVNVLRNMVKSGLLTRDKIVRDKKVVLCYKNNS